MSPESNTAAENIRTLNDEITGLLEKKIRLMRPEADPEAFVRYSKSFKGVRSPISHPRVVYQGVSGAFSEMASLDFFGRDAAITGLPNFEENFLALKEGRADYAVLPIENSTTGAIRQVYDLLTQYECYIVGETSVRVVHNLAVLPGTRLEDIHTVYSHEQALFQSEPFLSGHPDWSRIAKADTAGSAKIVAEGGDPHIAAICSVRAAELYGLEILVPAVNRSTSNTTRFVVISPVPELREGRDKICISLTTAHESGSLQEVLTIFSVHGLNLVRLESRPVPDRNWEYMFFIEFTGDLTAPGMRDVLRDLTVLAGDLRVFGNFRENLDTQVFS